MLGESPVVLDSFNTCRLMVRSKVSGPPVALVVLGCAHAFGRGIWVVCVVVPALSFLSTSFCVVFVVSTFYASNAYPLPSFRASPLGNLRSSNITLSARIVRVVARLRERMGVPLSIGPLQLLVGNACGDCGFPPGVQDRRLGDTADKVEIIQKTSLGRKESPEKS